MKCFECINGRLKAESVSDPDHWDNMVEITVYYKCDWCHEKWYVQVQQDAFQFKKIDQVVNNEISDKQYSRR